jgi:PAS domain S-box-containing protein
MGEEGAIMAETLKGRPKLLDSIPASFILTDMHTRILYVNQQAELFFGYAKEELEGKRLRFLFLEEDLLYFLPNIIFMTHYKNGFEGEVLLRQKDGAKIFVHLSTSSFKEGGEIFLTFFFQEIQRLKKSPTSSATRSPPSGATAEGFPRVYLPRPKGGFGSTRF